MREANGARDPLKVLPARYAVTSHCQYPGIAMRRRFVFLLPLLYAFPAMGQAATYTESPF